MLPFRNIVMPVDYSEQCRKVVPYAKEFIHRFSARVTLVHAYGAEALAYSDLALADPALSDEARAAEEDRLRQFACKMFPAEHTERMVALGEAGSVIESVVRRQGADLVMLATHGRGPVRRFLLGSVASKVLHDLSTPVWTCTGEALAERDVAKPYQSILCAIDESNEAEAVLKAGAALASTYNARLSLVHVVEMPTAAIELDFARYWEALRDAANIRLRELKGKLGVDAVHRVLEGPIAEVLHREAVGLHADLIVTGRGHAQGSVVSRFGSQLYSVVRDSPCPVLSI